LIFTPKHFPDSAPQHARKSLLSRDLPHTVERVIPPRFSMSPIISISNVSKTYASGLQALKRIDLEINKGEIFALLGPNGAGKSTLINIVCGIVTPSTGTVVADGHDIMKDYRQARFKIGLVPQELATDAFETVETSVRLSRGLFGRRTDPDKIEKVLRSLTLWERRGDKIMTLSGGMKRRVMIAKALAHEPTILFLDEPTAGVDVELRRDMWNTVRDLRAQGVTIILTTHYIEEAEEMADRVGVINKGELILVEEKTALMQKLGKKQLTLQLQEPLKAIPPELSDWRLDLKGDGYVLEYTYDGKAERTGIPSLLRRMTDIGILFKDLNTHQSSLEDIFVSLVSERQ
jgi:ABC-2 type transport system ATP-binding protein